MLFIPLYDDNPTRRTPVVTYGLVGLCVAVFLWQTSLGDRGETLAVFSYGMIPAVLFGHAELPAGLDKVPAWTTVFTSMFMHGGVLHLAGNMLYLWIFGNNVEDSMGRGRFIVFYLLCGVAAALAQSAANPASEVPMIGASGAIGGVLGAYLVLHPRANVRVFFWFLIIVRLLNIPAIIVLGFWFAGQVLSGVATPTDGDGGGVAFWAHVGGFVAGAVLILVFKRRGVQLLEPAHSVPFSVAPAPRFRRGSVPSAGDRRRWPPS
ncbi:rhomboid family intramembrane serine protease [Azospirillum sp. RWY-5-1]|uniref:Rhomboid family intramembrane serine protease n=1 Tax=Azospirillum oleiclasticum TaxID=2735135 RepID=A0ABX2TD37_9PROT|nr:rhomboid family intramembrane serine protease [Azospirillum oleiclasticum]NYZ13469.1 rhomboid family intramembrane serine protease [Azospirillum oleiclasticum]NYZ20630.1 rhomboid family intramembrane serine protease [Azospirillum oleiclasticum]